MKNPQKQTCPTKRIDGLPILQYHKDKHEGGVVPMTSWERFKRMYEHREADRIPIIDDPWTGTLRRWNREGMPEGMDWCDYFDVDKIGVINIDI